MRNIFILIVALFIIVPVSAIQITAEYPTNLVVNGFKSPIPITLEITNVTPGEYNLYTLADITINPSNTFEIDKDPFQKTFEITTYPDLDVEGNYAFTYTLNQKGIEKCKKKMLLTIINLEDILEISSESIDPTSDRLSFYIKNNANVYLKNVTATFSSVLFQITTTFDLGPNEKLTIPINVKKEILAKTAAGVYIINSKFQSENGEKMIEGKLYLGEKKRITTVEDKSGLIINTEAVTKVNTGNVAENIQIKMKRNIFSRLFTTFNIEPAQEERNGISIEYIWVKEKLAPTESYTIKAKTNYLFPFFLIIVLALIFSGYKRFSETKIEIKKSVSPVKTKGGEFALKVKLEIKAKKEVENVSLIDKVPSIVKIYKKFGITKPDKVDAERRKVHWNIGNLEAGEERSFSYIIYSKVGIVGKFSLPRAVSIFESEGNIHEVDSNNVFFMNEQADN